MRKRVLSTLLALCMVLGMLPGVAWAAEDEFVIENGVLTRYHGMDGNVTIPSGVTSIGEGAFSGIWDLISVTIPDGVASIGNMAFSNCRGLTNVTIPSSSAIKIGNFAFQSCTTLPSITIPSSVTSIGYGAFSLCHGLTTATIQPGVTSIGADAFRDCEKLVNLTIPSTVTSIGASAFSYCESLTNVSIPSGVTTIEDSTFSNCTSLTSITIPASVTKIGTFAFSECIALTDVYYGGDENDWNSIKIEGYDNKSLLDATIHYNSTGSSEKPDPGPTGPNIPNPGPQKEYRIYCNGGHETFNLSLEDCMARLPSTNYNSVLANMMIALSNAVYNSDDMVKNFESLGIKQGRWVPKKYITFSVGVKPQENGRTLVLAVVRGTLEPLDDVSGWLSNLNVTTNGRNEHAGFADAANEVYQVIKEYNVDFANADFVITGFSRGAAAANILAARLVDENVPQENIYAYAFACPDTIKTGKDLTDYRCIFNVANACDIVSWVPRTTHSEEWRKYGRSRWYSNSWDLYEYLKMGLAAHNQVEYLSYLKSRPYWSEFRDSVEARAVLDEALVWRDNKFWDDVYQNTIGYLGVHCPVNVEIYAAGDLVGSVNYGVLEISDGDKVYISVNGTEKDIYLLDDAEYSLKMTAYDVGEMSFIIQNIDASTREAVDEQIFEHVVLSENKQFISDVTVKDNTITDVEPKDVKLYVVTENGTPEKEVLPDGSGTEIPITTPGQPSQPNQPNIPSTPSVASAPSSPSRPSSTSAPSTPSATTTPPADPKPAEPAPSAPAEVILPFTDVFPTDWFYSSVQYVYAKGLMTGDGSTTIFNPSGTMTRAMVWTVLGRMAGADVNGTGGQWYAKAQAWATASGVSDGSNPDGGITREELVTMLWRSAGSPAMTADLSGFTDSASVSGWAGAAMQWAVANGILSGDNGALKPNAPAARAEVAAILMRFCENR